MQQILNMPHSLQIALTSFGQTLRHKNLCIATAESCTAGLLGAAFTSIAGSSAWYMGGIIAYDNNVKISQLDVPQHIIDEHGAVSEACVLRMACGICHSLNTDIGISISGIAGPDGGTREKPVGTVWIGFSVLGHESAKLFSFAGTRDEVRSQAVFHAVQEVIKKL